jgi:hypothetical protein
MPNLLDGVKIDLEQRMSKLQGEARPQWRNVLEVEVKVGASDQLCESLENWVTRISLQ